MSKAYFDPELNAVRLKMARSSLTWPNNGRTSAPSTPAVKYASLPDPSIITKDSVFICLLLISCGLKPSSDAYEAYGGFVDIDPEIAFICDYSIYAFVIVLVLFLSRIASRNPSKEFPFLLVSLSLIKIFLIIRVTFAQVIDLKLYGSVVLIGMIALWLASARSMAEKRELRNAAISGIFLFSVLLTVINSWEYWRGQGYIENIPRFFGTTGHPNFIGIQMTVAVISAFCVIIESRRLAIRLLAGLLLLNAFILLLASGSRTALFCCVLGVIASIVQKGLEWSLRAVVVVFLSILAGAFYEIVSPGTFSLAGIDALDRGDNRSDVWSELITIIQDSPLFGVGVILGAPSESSYLRTAALCGVPIGVAFFLTAISSLWLGYRQRGGGQSSFFFAILVAFAAGGFLEGFLNDAFTEPAVIWWICLGISSQVRLSITQSPPTVPN